MQKSEILSYVSISSSNVSRENWEDLEYLKFNIQRIFQKYVMFIIFGWKGQTLRRPCVGHFISIKLKAFVQFILC